ncbi:MAG: protein kinase [Myxococcota bacterium]|jgi:serine/threonine protein kinase|nr:protein kinase [Myxococcota bacterium]
MAKQLSQEEQEETLDSQSLSPGRSSSSLEDAPEALDSLEGELAALFESELPPSALLGQVWAGKYRFDAFIGEGGMGRLFRVSHLETGGTLAIKLLAGAKSSAKARERFRIEARNAARLRHPNTVRVYDCGFEHGHHYLLMEYVDGVSLEELVRRLGPLPWQRVVPILVQVCKSLWEAHEQRIVHRDIKPANLLLSAMPGAHDFVKVADFGISRALEGEGADTQGILGSPQTMAPEQWSGEAVGPAADLYGLGCTAYHLLTGHPVFQASSMASLGHLHVNVEPKALAEMVEGIPLALSGWVQRMMAKRPEARFESAQAALEALEQVERSNTVSRSAELEAEPRKEAPTPSPGAAPVPSTVGGAKRMPLVVGLLATLLLLGLTFWFLLSKTERTPASSSTAASSPPSAQLQAPAAPSEPSQPTPSLAIEAEPIAPRSFRRPCIQQDGQCRSEDTRAWCDAEGTVLACCAPGMVPAGDRGMCTCAAGGVHDLALQQKGCPAPLVTDVKGSVQATISALQGRWKACYQEALLDAPQVSGRVLLTFAVGPGGEVYDARIAEGDLPSLDVQRCILDALEQARFYEPADGWVEISYPVHFNTEP